MESLKSGVTPVFTARARARMAAAEAQGRTEVLSMLPVPDGPRGVRARLQLRVHLAGTHAGYQSNTVAAARFSRLPGQRVAYVSTASAGAVFRYDLRDLGANPAPRVADPRGTLMYGDLPRGTVHFEGMLTDRQRATEHPLVVTAEHAGARRAVVLLERLLPTATGAYAPSPIDPRPRNDKYQWARLGDFDGDGREDIVAFNSTPVVNRGPVRLATTMYLYQGAADGAFRFVSQLVLDHHYSEDPRVVDLDGDGRDELVMINDCTVRGSYVMFCSPPGNPGAPQGAGMVVVEQSGGVLRARPTQWFDPVFSASPMVVADLDGDGRKDIASGVIERNGDSNRHVDGVLVYYGQADGTFASRRYPEIPRGTWSDGVDLDGDGCTELLHVGWNEVTVWGLRDRTPTRQPVALELSAPNARGEFAGLVSDHYDFDHDGDEDLLVAGLGVGIRRPGQTTGSVLIHGPLWLIENLTEQAPRQASASPRVPVASPARGGGSG